MAKALNKPTVRFSARAWQKMWALTHACPIEISAMGIVEPKENYKKLGIKEDFYVTDFFVVDQECSGTSTDMDESALIDLHMDLREQGVKSEDICVWWHSHVNMDTGHSGTDENQIERFDFDKVCISAITNKKGSLNLRIDMYEPIRHTFEKCSHVVDDIPVISKEWGKEMVDKHVTRATPAVMSIKKAPGKPKTSWVTHTNGLGKTWYRNGYDAWNESYFDASEPYVGVVEQDEPEEEVEEVYPLDFPHKLLQECYDEGIIEPNEALRYYGKLCSKDISDEELDEELESLFDYETTEELDGEGNFTLKVGQV